MRTPVLPALLLLFLASCMYALPTGALHRARLWVAQPLARLWTDPAAEAAAPAPATDRERELYDLLIQNNAIIADLRQQLRTLGAAEQAVPGMRILQARVIRLSPEGTLDTFMIDAGTADGAAQGQAVVVGNALAGIIAHAEEHASLVQSVVSTGSYLPARFGAPPETVLVDRILGAVRGLGAGRAGAVIFSPSTPVGSGWVAQTTNLDPRVPEGLIIGTVRTAFEEGSENGTVEARLEPAADLQYLDWVAIVARQEE